MLAFLDTEFTDLVIRPRLLSVGLVTDRGSDQEFYAEVTDPDRIHATNWFGLASVLPQFGKVAHSACTYAELCNRLCAFLGDLVAGLKSEEFVELAYGYHLDWELVELAVGDAASTSWAATRRRIRPVNVYAFTGFGAAKLAAETYFKDQTQAPISRHHALCDARALRMACEAAERVPDEPGQAMMPLERQPQRIVAA